MSRFDIAKPVNFPQVFSTEEEHFPLSANETVTVPTIQAQRYKILYLLGQPLNLIILPSYGSSFCPYGYNFQLFNPGLCFPDLATVFLSEDTSSCAAPAPVPIRDGGWLPPACRPAPKPSGSRPLAPRSPHRTQCTPHGRPFSAAPSYFPTPQVPQGSCHEVCPPSFGPDPRAPHAPGRASAPT